MPRPLRQPTETERAELDIIADINKTIVLNIERNKNLSKDRRERVQSLTERGWSMYGIALNTGITPNTVKRILAEKPKPEPQVVAVLGEAQVVDES